MSTLKLENNLQLIRCELLFELEQIRIQLSGNLEFNHPWGCVPLCVFRRAEELRIQIPTIRQFYMDKLFLKSLNQIAEPCIGVVVVFPAEHPDQFTRRELIERLLRIVGFYLSNNRQKQSLFIER